MEGGEVTADGVRERDLAGVPGDASVIDADVHATLPSTAALLPYLSEQWHEYLSLWGHTYFFRPSQISYPPNAPTTRRPGVDPSELESSEAGLEALRRDVLDGWGVEYAVVGCPYYVDMFHSPYVAQAMSAAANDWLIAEWLAPESRLRGSIVVAASQPEMAAGEIERVGGHPAVVQVTLPVRASRPYGNQIYLPLFEAAAANDLVIGLHHGGWPGNAPTGIGWPSFYIEEYVARASHVQAQLMSLVVEGVFARFPSLRVAAVECGWSWLPPFLWRFDKDWKGLQRETPWVDRLPSELIAEHVRFTLQPNDGPPDGRQLEMIYDEIGSDELLMFSTDFPHWHYDEARQALPAAISEASLRRLLSTNARALYRL